MVARGRLCASPRSSTRSPSNLSRTVDTTVVTRAAGGEAVAGGEAGAGEAAGARVRCKVTSSKSPAAAPDGRERPCHSARAQPAWSG